MYTPLIRDILLLQLMPPMPTFTLSLHDALPIWLRRPALHNRRCGGVPEAGRRRRGCRDAARSEEHTSELQSRPHIVCRLLLEKKKSELCGVAAHRGDDAGAGIASGLGPSAFDCT